MRHVYVRSCHLGNFGVFDIAAAAIANAGETLIYICHAIVFSAGYL